MSPAQPDAVASPVEEGLFERLAATARAIADGEVDQAMMSGMSGEDRADGTAKPEASTAEPGGERRREAARATGEASGFGDPSWAVSAEPAHYVPLAALGLLGSLPSPMATNAEPTQETLTGADPGPLPTGTSLASARTATPQAIPAIPETSADAAPVASRIPGPISGPISGGIAGGIVGAGWVAGGGTQHATPPPGLLQPRPAVAFRAADPAVKAARPPGIGERPALAQVGPATGHAATAAPGTGAAPAIPGTTATPAASETEALPWSPAASTRPALPSLPPLSPSGALSEPWSVPQPARPAGDRSAGRPAWRTGVAMPMAPAGTAAAAPVPEHGAPGAVPGLPVWRSGPAVTSGAPTLTIAPSAGGPRMTFEVTQVVQETASSAQPAADRATPERPRVPGPVVAPLDAVQPSPVRVALPPAVPRDPFGIEPAPRAPGLAAARAQTGADSGETGQPVQVPDGWEAFEPGTAAESGTATEREAAAPRPETWVQPSDRPQTWAERPESPSAPATARRPDWQTAAAASDRMPAWTGSPAGAGTPSTGNGSVPRDSTDSSPDVSGAPRPSDGSSGMPLGAPTAAGEVPMMAARTGTLAWALRASALPALDGADLEAAETPRRGSAPRASSPSGLLESRDSLSTRGEPLQAPAAAIDRTTLPQAPATTTAAPEPVHADARPTEAEQSELPWWLRAPASSGDSLADARSIQGSPGNRGTQQSAGAANPVGTSGTSGSAAPRAGVAGPQSGGERVVGADARPVDPARASRPRSESAEGGLSQGLTQGLTEEPAPRPSHLGTALQTSAGALDTGHGTAPTGGSDALSAAWRASENARGVLERYAEALGGQTAYWIRASLHSGRRETAVTLDPPQLGRLRISLVQDGSLVTARIRAELPEVEALLRQGGERIRQRLSDQGVRVDALIIEASPARATRGAAAPEPQLQQHTQDRSSGETPSHGGQRHPQRSGRQTARDEAFRPAEPFDPRPTARGARTAAGAAGARQAWAGLDVRA